MTAPGRLRVVNKSYKKMDTRKTQAPLHDERSPRAEGEAGLNNARRTVANTAPCGATSRHQTQAGVLISHRHARPRCGLGVDPQLTREESKRLVFNSKTLSLPNHLRRTPRTVSASWANHGRHAHAELGQSRSREIPPYRRSRLTGKNVNISAREDSETCNPRGHGLWTSLKPRCAGPRQEQEASARRRETVRMTIITSTRTPPAGARPTSITRTTTSPSQSSRSRAAARQDGQRVPGVPHAKTNGHRHLPPQDGRLRSSTPGIRHEACRIPTRT